MIIPSKFDVKIIAYVFNSRLKYDFEQNFSLPVKIVENLYAYKYREKSKSIFRVNK